MIRMSCYLLLLMISVLAHAQIYKWIGSDGSTHFSDKPHQGAESISLPEAQTYSAPADSGSAFQASNGDNKDKEPAGYEQIEITNPLNQDTIRDNQGLINVSVKLTPSLKSGDKLQLIYDGNKLGQPQDSPYFIINNANRGTHTLSVEVQDSEGNVLNTSESVTIFMHRARLGQAGG